MKIVHIHQAETLSLNASIVAIGAFDGVHLGHQAVIRKMIEKSLLLKIPSVVYTFDPPPRVYFNNTKQLTSIKEKIEKISLLGVDHVVVARFDYHYLNRSVDQFINELFALNPKEIIVGDDFRFGKGRNGGIEDLKRVFQVKVIEKICCEKGRVISSTRIREMLLNGENEEVEALLNG
ncbi:FAD synthetase family protein [Alkalihalobacterium elongatum]|uniref:FAD synthetase family protein n=1 Tax=Alkalihalobacterium elongatum TaxID=2675466 RepID=UPI001C1FB6E3|nr:FAD synthetase family protein [Alkalihalobacterium elongatum]